MSSSVIVMKNKIKKVYFIVSISGFLLSLPVLYFGYSAMWEKGTQVTVYADNIFTAGLLIFTLSILSFIIWIILININKKNL
jgi:hypothetical protein